MDTQFSSKVRDFVDVQLKEFNTLNLVRESQEMWKHQFGGSNPGCVAVDDDNLVIRGIQLRSRKRVFEC